MSSLPPDELHDDSVISRSEISTEGRLDPQHVTDPKPQTTHFRFTDLPLELRQIVYDLALPSRDYQLIKISTGGELSTGLWRSYCPRTITGPPINNLATVLRLSKAISAEARSHYYGTNVFEFAGLSGMTIFLPAIGRANRSQLRQLRLNSNGYDFHTAGKAFSQLQDALQLRSLTMRLDLVCWSGTRKYVVTPAHVVRDAKPMLEGLLEMKRQHGEDVGDVLNILQVERRGCGLRHSCNVVRDAAAGSGDRPCGYPCKG